MKIKIGDYMIMYAREGLCLGAYFGVLGSRLPFEGEATWARTHCLERVNNPFNGVIEYGEGNVINHLLFFETDLFYPLRKLKK